MGRGVEAKSAWDGENTNFGMAMPRMLEANQKLAKALSEAAKGSNTVEAFEDLAKQQAAEEKSKLTIIGRVLLRTTSARIAKDLAEANETVKTRSSGENAQTYLAARDSAIVVFIDYTRLYMGELYVKRKTPIVRPYFHLAKAADKFSADIHKITANK